MEFHAFATKIKNRPLQFSLVYMSSYREAAWILEMTDSVSTRNYSRRRR